MLITFLARLDLKTFSFTDVDIDIGTDNMPTFENTNVI